MEVIPSSVLTGNKQTKADIAYRKIRKMILTNDLTPRNSLTEARLCTELGLSRTPVRSALQRLSYDGLVEYTPDKGMSVTQFVLADLLEIAEVRIPNECLAVSMAVERMTDADILELEACAKENLAAANSKQSMECFELDNLFHILLARGSKNHRVSQIVCDLVELSERGTFLSKTDVDRIQVASHVHMDILDAVQNRNQEKAVSAMRSHLDNWIEYTKQQQLDNYYLYR